MGQGAHLASVTSSAINDYILRGLTKRSTSDTNNELWIGGTDSNEEGVWTWTDGTSWNFTYWTKGEPNDGLSAVKSEDCLSLNTDSWSNGHWNDISCDHEYPFICKGPERDPTKGTRMNGNYSFTLTSHNISDSPFNLWWFNDPNIDK